MSQALIIFEKDHQENLSYKYDDFWSLLRYHYIRIKAFSQRGKLLNSVESLILFLSFFLGKLFKV